MGAGGAATAPARARTAAGPRAPGPARPRGRPRRAEWWRSATGPPGRAGAPGAGRPPRRRTPRSWRSPSGQRLRQPLAVASGRLEALERLAQVRGRALAVRRARGAGLGPDRSDVLPAPVVAQGGAGVVQEYAQVGARVAVERRKDLVRVHVGQRVGHPHPAALLELPGLRRAGVERQDHPRLLLDLAPHGPGPISAAFKSGGPWRWHGSSGR